MPLRLTLKPRERVIISGAVVKNGDSRIELFIENQVPILREADILSPNAVNTPCERVYLAVQLMYVDQDRETQHRQSYEALVRDVLEAAPSTKQLVQEMEGAIQDSLWTQAVKLKLGETVVTGELPDCPCELSGGDLINNIFTYRDHAPLPIDWRGDTRCTLTVAGGDSPCTIDAASIQLEQIGHPRYIKHIDK